MNRLPSVREAANRLQHQVPTPVAVNAASGCVIGGGYQQPPPTFLASAYGSTTTVQVYVPGLRFGAETAAWATFPLGESPMSALEESTQVIWLCVRSEEHTSELQS